MLKEISWEVEFGQEQPLSSTSSTLMQPLTGVICSTFSTKKFSFLEFGSIWMNMLTSVMDLVLMKLKIDKLKMKTNNNLRDQIQHSTILMICLITLEKMLLSPTQFPWTQPITEVWRKLMFMLLELSWKHMLQIYFWRAKIWDLSLSLEVQLWDLTDMASTGLETIMPTLIS